MALSAQENSSPYIVTFEGISDKEILDLLKDASQSIELQKKPPRTQAALRRRIETDLSTLVKALRSIGYYDARVTHTVDFSVTPNHITFVVELGAVYTIGGFEILPKELSIPPSEVGIKIGYPALAKKILEAEEELIHLLRKRGYPLALIKDREVIADRSNKQLQIQIKTEEGPLAFFGETTIKGTCSVWDAFIKKKILWKKGEVYDPKKVDCTLEALEAAGLFSSINITHGEIPDPDNSLPMTIHVIESKHRTIGIGLSYSTQRGGGFTTQWEHRNIRGLGERVKFETNVLRLMQEASLSYIKPDFCCPEQDLIWKAEIQHDDTEGFKKTSYSISGELERQLNPKTRISYGGKYEHLQDNDGTFNLAKIPLHLRWSNVDDPLDPTCGASLDIKTTPTVQLLEKQFAYTKSSLIGSAYYPLNPCRSFVLATKLNIGTILGSSRGIIPRSERFYAGSENTLRGYNYYTVSPLDKDHDPIGGRSLFVYTLEGRYRFSEKWGGVLFYDVGNVYPDPTPQLNKKMLQSVGVGARYYTPVGPLRLDVAYPLNRRPHVDKPFQVYFSVGQSF